MCTDSIQEHRSSPGARHTLTDIGLPALPLVNLPHRHHCMRWSVPTGPPTVSERSAGETRCLQGTDASYFAKSIGLKTIASSSRSF